MARVRRKLKLLLRKPLLLGQAATGFSSSSLKVTDVPSFAPTRSLPGDPHLIEGIKTKDQTPCHVAPGNGADRSAIDAMGPVVP